MDTRTDSDLMAAYADACDENAFAELAARHQQMVYRACLRMLRHHQEAEDATQAVFLVLLNKASRLMTRKGEFTGWLYGVARNVCLEALRKRARRQEEAMLDETEEPAVEEYRPAHEEVLPFLDEELAGLTGVLRQAVVLRYLQNHSEAEAAQRAGCAVGTLSSRASRGIERLRQRLAKRGVALGGVALASLLSSEASAAVPETLLPSILATVKTAAATTATATTATSTAAMLAKGAMQVMYWNSVKTAAMVVAAAIAAGGAGVTAVVAVAEKEAPKPVAAAAIVETTNAQSTASMSASKVHIGDTAVVTTATTPETGTLKDADGLTNLSDIRSLCAAKKFPKALAIIAKQPDQDSLPVWAMRLSVADGYYTWGMYSNAQAIYQSFFNKYPDGPTETLRPVYVASAYKYVQMMLLTGQESVALGAYRAILKDKTMERAVQRQIEAEMAELIVKMAANPKTPAAQQKSLMDEASRICKDSLMWVQDVWFGKAIVLLAHIKMLQGDIDGSQKVVDENWDILKQIDDMLRKDAKENPDIDWLKISPLANCHYMLGVIMQNEAEKLLAAGDKAKAIILLTGKATDTKTDSAPHRSFGAFQHLTTVFAEYPASSWALDAEARCRKMQESLARLGVDVQIKIKPEKVNPVAGSKPEKARTNTKPQIRE